MLLSLLLWGLICHMTANYTHCLTVETFDYCCAWSECSRAWLSVPRRILQQHLKAGSACSHYLWIATVVLVETQYSIAFLPCFLSHFCYFPVKHLGWRILSSFTRVSLYLLQLYWSNLRMAPTLWELYQSQYKCNPPPLSMRNFHSNCLLSKSLRSTEAILLGNKKMYSDERWLSILQLCEVMRGRDLKSSKHIISNQNLCWL